MRALVIGRFQPFHKGHLAILDAAIEGSASVVVGIGSSQAAGTEKNPFTADEREAMIRACAGVDVVHVPDIFDPPNWVSHVQRIVGDFDVVYGNDEDTLALFVAADIPVVRPGLQHRDSWQGAVIRAQIAVGDVSWKASVPSPVAELVEKLQG